MKLMVKVFCSLILLTSIVSALEIDGNTYAQREELLFREIPKVFAGVRKEQEITEAPSFVTVITDKQIKDFGYRTLAEVLRSVTGFYISYDREYTRTGVRGYNRPGDRGNRILLMVNNHYYNENIYGGSYTDDTFGIDLDLIKRIEIIRGPGSAPYGSNALLAVINVVTKTGKEIEGTNLEATYGTFNTCKGSISYGRGKENNNFLISGSLFNSEGNKHLYFPEFDNPTTNRGWAEDLDWMNGYHFFTNLNASNLSLFANASYRKKAYPTAAHQTIFNDSRASDEDRRSFIELKLQPKISEDKSSLLRFYYDDYAYRGNFPLDYSSPTLNQDHAEGKWFGSEAQLSWHLNHNHYLILGTEYQNHYRVYQENYGTDPYVLYLSDNRPFNILSLYLQDEIKLEKMGITLGVRNDNYSHFGSVTNPRLGIIINPLEKTYLKFLYGRAFRTPTPYEMYYDDNYIRKSNPGLRPETIDTYELVLERGSFADYYSSLSLYQSKISDLISLVEDPVDHKTQYQNLEKTSAQGIEFYLRKKLGGLIAYGYLGYSYAKSVNEITNRILENYPDHSATAGLVFTPGEKTTLATEFHYVGRRLTRAGEFTQPYLLTNLNLNTTELKSWEINLKINNLFDISYVDPASREHCMNTIAQDGRTWYIKVSRRF